MSILGMVEYAIAKANSKLQSLDTVETISEKRNRVIMALMASRRENLSHGHDWDIADVMRVLDEQGLLE